MALEEKTGPYFNPSSSRISRNDNVPEELRSKIQAILLDAVVNRRNVSLDLEISSFGEKGETEIGNAVQAITKKSRLGRGKGRSNGVDTKGRAASRRVLAFPHSRHSSYPELCDFLKAFRPKDVWPCTVDPVDWLRNGKSSSIQCPR